MHRRRLRATDSMCYKIKVKREAEALGASPESENPVSLDWRSPELIADPYPIFDRLRETDPIHNSAFGWVLSRHAEISVVLRDRRFGRDFVNSVRRHFGDEMLAEPAYHAMQYWVLLQDPPDHTRLRGLIAHAFTPRRIEEMRSHIQEIVERLVAGFSRHHVDLVTDFASKIPVIVICEMLGIPPDDVEMVLNTARHSGRLIEPAPLTRAEIDQANAGNLALSKYFQGLFDLRRRQPKDDLATHLVQLKDQFGKLSDEELTANTILLFGAGHETTINLIGNSLFTLYRHPDQLQLLRDDPTLVENAVEECMRYDSPVQIAGRIALEDSELGGTAIKQGEAVHTLLGAANRDPSVYAEPNRFDIRRPNVRPMSFGGGIHFCLGAPLARLEAALAVSTLLREIPGLELVDPAHPDWRPTFGLRGLKTLLASW
jgi:cytochrome P450